MTLTLNDLRVDCIIGERPSERTAPQTLRLDLALDIPDETAAVTDELADTVDYAALAAQVAEALNVSRNVLDKRFHADLNRSIGEEIKRQRIALAKLLLRNSGASVAEIAKRTGFCTPSHLANTFRASTGQTPSAWRRQG